jgi:chromosome segregation ATPase
VIEEGEIYMGKVFDAFKHLLIEDDNEDRKEDQKEEDKQEQKSDDKIIEKKPEPVAVKPTITEVGIDKETEVLRNKLVQSAMANAGDYVKFYDMVESLRSMIPDERTCYKAAFTAVSKISPMTVQGLVTSLEGCVKALDGEITTFQETIQGRQTNIDGLRKQIQEKNDQIVKLQNEVKELLAKIEEETRKNDQVGANFDRATKSAKYNFESMITKINSYLGGDKNDGTT